MGLPIITNPEPRSLSYFKYAKNAMKVGDMNPIYSGVQMPYHPYHLPSNTDPLYKSQQLLNNPNVGEHPYLNTYPLPPIGKNKENNLKAIKSGELVDFPDETYIPLSQFVNYRNKKEMEIKMNKEKEKAKEEEKLRMELYGVNGNKKPSGAYDIKLFHKKNLKHWRFMKNATNIICGYLRMKKLAFGHKNLHAKRFVLLQSAKEGMATIRDFLLPILSNIEDYCVEFFRSTIIFNSNNKEKLEKSIFTTKSFIHQLFSDLTSALAKRDDIPVDIKKIINLYTNDGSLLPYGFLSTFEFNRLEFTTDGLLTNMNLDRKGMIVCFIVLYRVLLIDIFKRYLFYFKKIREMEVDELTLLEAYEKHLGVYEQKLKEKFMKSKHKQIKRGNVPGMINEEESEEDDDEKEKKLFLKDKQEENEQIEMEKNEIKNKGNKNANPPKKNNIKNNNKKEEESEEEEDEEEEEEEDDEEEEEEESDSKPSKNNKDKNNKNINKKNSIKSNKKSDQSKNTKSSKISSSKKSDKSKKSKKKLKGKEYGYSGYLDKKKGKEYHKKGIYFDDDREKEVPKDLLKEEERQREEKLKEKLEESRSSKSSIESESSSSKKSKKDKKSKNSKNSKTSKSKISSEISKTITSKSISDLSSSKSSRKPKNINEEFWGFDLEKKEQDELNKNRRPVKVQLDPLQQRKERIKKLPKELRIKILEEERSKLNLKVKHNFHVVSNILHSIFKSAMSENVPLFSEYYKEKFLYKDLVFQKTHQQYSNGNDEIELSKGIIIDEESTEIFLTKNQRWAQMYKLLTFQFCRDFAEKCKL